MEFIKIGSLTEVSIYRNIVRNRVGVFADESYRIQQAAIAWMFWSSFNRQEIKSC